jgi:hypothetical protein
MNDAGLLDGGFILNHCQSLITLSPAKVPLHNKIFSILLFHYYSIEKYNKWKYAKRDYCNL